MRSDHYGLQREEAHRDHALIPGEAGIALDPRLGRQTRAPRQRRDRDEYPSGDGKPLRGPSPFRGNAPSGCPRQRMARAGLASQVSHSGR